MKTAYFMFLCFSPKNLLSLYVYVCVVYLKGDTANRQVLVILQHAEVLSHQGGSVHQTHCRLRVTLPVVVLLCHVLQPGQAEVRRRLVAFCYPGEIWEWEKGSFSPLSFPFNLSGKSLSEIKISLSENCHMLDKQVHKW